MTADRCMHHLNYSGAQGKRCADRPIRGSTLCALHRDEGLRRVAMNLNQRAILLRGLRWGTPVVRRTG